MRHPNPSNKKSPETNNKNSNKSNKITPCCAKVGLKRGPWTPEEDEILSSFINKEGSVGRWRTLPKRAGLARCGKSCRLRWMNYLRPTVKRGHIAPDEEDLILRLHRLLGNRWSLIAGRIPGRTDNEIKNYWNTHLSKKLISQGIDPRTHKPLDPNNLPSNDKPSTSSKPNLSQNPNPKLSSQPSPNAPIVPNQFNENYGYFQGGVDMDPYQGLNFQNSDGIQNEENGEHENINDCTDDIFSSFLNSLINEDHLFSNNQNQMQQQNIVNGHNILPQVSNLDASISLPQVGFAFGSAGWDAPIMSALNQNHDPKSLSDDDQLDKC